MNRKSNTDKNFEETFNISIPEEEKIGFNTLKDLMVSIGSSLKSDNKSMEDRLQDGVKDIKKEMEGVKGQFKEVQRKVDDVSETVESLKKRIEQLEKHLRLGLNTELWLLIF